jgi:signal transduction histidine kinase
LDTYNWKRMFRLNHKISSIVIIFLFIFSQNSFPQRKIKNVVIFFSLSANLPSYQNFIEGFNSTLSIGNGEPRNLIIEYLDIGRTENELYAKHIIDLYNTKFSKTNIDLLITFGPGIYPILEKYGLKVLNTSRSINIDLDLPDRKYLQTSGDENSINLILKLLTRNTLKTAFGLFPDYKNVFVISGISKTDKFFTSSIENCKMEFEPEYNFTFISDITMDSTIQYVKGIPANSIVIVTTYLLDKNNVPFSTPEVLSTISHNCKAPLFPVTDSFTKKEGGIGGNILSFVYLGKETGRIALEILNGKPFREITVNGNSFYRNIYDWQQLKKWDLLNSRGISTDSIFYNKEISFFSKYKWYLFGSLIFIFSQTLLILYLIRLNRRQKKIAKEMVETENMYRELIREDRLAKMTVMTASLAHELNQPLTAILYSAQAGKRFLQSGKLDQKQANEIFDNIIEDDKRAGGIISSVKGLMKIETRENEKVNLNALIQETVNIIHSEAVRQGIRINLKLAASPAYLIGDRIQLQQVLLNFIRNATIALEHFNRENKTLEIVQLLNKGSVTVSVRDNGPGINEEIKEKLFKPFITSRSSGFGIGLALSRSIIEKHKGDIWANNLAEGGAEFSFRLHIIKNE